MHYVFSLHVCTCKGKNKKPTDKQWKEKVQRTYERGIKQISMIDIAIKETRKQANKRLTSKKANKRWCLRGTNVDLDRMPITSLC